MSGTRPINHGTYGGYQTEGKRGLEHCDACRAANTEYNRDRRRSKAPDRPPVNPAYPRERVLPGAMARLVAEDWQSMTSRANASPNHVSRRCSDCGYLRTAPGHLAQCGGAP